MLHLQSESDQRWLAQVDASLDEILIDHAHCERKAATTAINLLNSYTDDLELGQEMTTIVQEELEHYWMVIKLLSDRQIPFRRLQPGLTDANSTGLSASENRTELLTGCSSQA